MNIYVGNLPQKVDSDALKAAFEAFGKVLTTKVILDRETGESRGFGFVEMPVVSEAESAITGLNETEFEGQAIKVSEARSRSVVNQDVGMRGGKMTRGGGRRF